jgi:predicted ester cyclase
MTLSATDSKQLVGRYLQALSGRRSRPIVARFVSDPHLVEHILQAEAAFPFYELVAEDLIAERNLVALRGTFRGVHGGPFAGIQATGRAVTADLMIIYRIEGDRIAQHWMMFDAAGVIAQLTTPAAALA